MKRKYRPLTGAELRLAAANRLPVYYEETYYNPHDKHLAFRGRCVMEPAAQPGAYYIGNSDICTSDFADDATVEGDFPEGVFGVYALPGVDYACVKKINQHIRMSKKLTDLQVDVLLEVVRTTLAKASHAHIIAKLLRDGSCIVAGDGSEFNGGYLYNYVLVAAAEDCIDCVRLTLDVDHVLRAPWLKGFISAYRTDMQRKQAELNRIVDAATELVHWDVISKSAVAV